ncbi:hypothetical protein BJP36_41715 [Moorena producens JHB]|uniref:Uncharacterized protein n=1 Tax=Moorena producens (strain JHB) TaxID=1454205 RepID=A0A9Q9UVJ3_MOOP1|nr:hypothetical protein [Moorena producens]WAN68884.1 hypothetical protein BJP36_41715 [Moorena producens JHB]
MGRWGDGEMGRWETRAWLVWEDFCRQNFPLSSVSSLSPHTSHTSLSPHTSHSSLSPHTSHPPDSRLPIPDSQFPIPNSKF